jgi:hypothetical protein
VEGRREILRQKILARCVQVGKCLVWTGPDSGKTGRGKEYPRMNVDGGTMAVHRVWFIIHHGPIPPRKQLDHTCKTRRCVSCTEMVTHKQNMKRRDESNGVVASVKGKRKRVRRNKGSVAEGRGPRASNKSTTATSRGAVHDGPSFGEGTQC